MGFFGLCLALAKAKCGDECKANRGMCYWQRPKNHEKIGKCDEGKQGQGTYCSCGDCYRPNCRRSCEKGQNAREYHLDQAGNTQDTVAMAKLDASVGEKHQHVPRSSAAKQEGEDVRRDHLDGTLSMLVDVLRAAPVGYFLDVFRIKSA